MQTQTAPTLTPTVAGLLAPPAECPAPGSPRLPAEPPSFSQFDEAIAQYLSAGGAPTIIEGRLAAWGALTDYGGLVRSDRDFTGDGFVEVANVREGDSAPDGSGPVTLALADIFTLLFYFGVAALIL